LSAAAFSLNPYRKLEEGDEEEEGKKSKKMAR